MLSLIAAISGIYDALLGIAMLAARGSLARLFDVPLPVPAIHAELNGVFLIAVAVGYAWPWREPQKYRWYLWVMGPLLKGGGAAIIALDVALGRSPAAFLTIAATDGGLALATLAALLLSRPPGARAGA
jgi:hypothetical protein